MNTEVSTKNARNRRIGLSISYVAIAAQIVISLLFTPYILNTIGDRQYGLYGFVSSISSWLDTLLIAIGSGFAIFLSKAYHEKGEEGERRANGVFFLIFQVLAILTIVLGLLLWLLLFLRVIPLSEYTDSEQSTIRIILLITLVSTTLTTILTSYKCYFYYKQAFIIVNSIGLISTLSQTGLSFILLSKGFGVLSIAIANSSIAAAVSIVQTFISLFVLKEKMILFPRSPQEKSENRALIKEIMIFSSFVIINTIVDIMNKNIDKTILGFANANSIANYQLAANLSGYVTSLSSAVEVVFIQKVNEVYFSDNGHTKLNDLFQSVSKFQMIIVFLITGGFAACGYSFVTAWIGESRIQVFYIALILMAINLVPNCALLSIEARRVQGLHKKAAFVYLGTTITNIGASILFVFLMPKEQAIWACVFGTISATVGGQWIAMALYDQKLTGLKMPMFYRNIFVFFFATFVCSGSVILIFRFGVKLTSLNPWIVTCIEGFSFVILYSIFLLLFERAFLKSIWTSIKRK